MNTGYFGKLCVRDCWNAAMTDMIHTFRSPNIPNRDEVHQAGRDYPGQTGIVRMPDDGVKETCCRYESGERFLKVFLLKK